MAVEVELNGTENRRPDGGAPDNRQAKIRRLYLLNRILSSIPAAACLCLGLLYLVSAYLNGYDLRLGFDVIVSNASLVALVATGATFLFTAGSFDLSLGANMLVSALLGGLVGRMTGNLWLLAAVSVGVAVLLSLLNSVLASFFNLPVFIMTIVMMNVYNALSRILITSFGVNAAVSVPIGLVSHLNTTAFRVLVLLLFELFACFIFYILKTGRKQKFLGGNPICAYLTGIRPKKLTILSFGLAGIGIGLAAILMVVETPTLSASSGSSVGMNMLIALVFGGMKISGGPQSRMYAALLGAFSMAFLDAFMNIYVSGSWYLQIVKGVLFVVVVFLFSLANRSRLLER